MEFLPIILPPFALLALCVVIVRTRNATDKTPTCMDQPEAQMEKLLAASGPEDVRYRVSRDADGNMVRKAVLVDPWSSSTFRYTKRY